MGEDPDAPAQEQAEGRGGEGGAEKVSLERRFPLEAGPTYLKNKGPGKTSESNLCCSKMLKNSLQASKSNIINVSPQKNL